MTAMMAIHESMAYHEWKILQSMMVSKRFSLYITNHTTIKRQIQQQFHRPLIHLINEARNMRNIDYHMTKTGDIQYFLVLFPELIKMCDNINLIKFGNNKCAEKINYIKRSSIYKIAMDYKTSYYKSIADNFETHIINYMIRIIEGNIIRYKPMDIEKKIQYKTLSDDVTYIHEILVGVPANKASKDIEIILTTRKINLSSMILSGDSCLLQSFMKYDQRNIADEYARHQCYDTKFEKHFKRYCKTFDAAEVEIKRCNQLQSIYYQLLKRLKISKRKYSTLDLDDILSVVGLERDLFDMANAKIIRRKKLYLQDFVDKKCNVCGKGKKRDNVWLMCNKHGFTHSKCNLFGSLCCSFC